MSNSEDYNKGYQAGYWFGNDDAYRQGYEEGRQAEHNRIKRTIDGNSPTNESSPLWSMISCSVILTLCGWCAIGLILFLFWIGGCSGSWWFPWIWRITFWCGIGFIVLMSIAGVVATIDEEHETKNPPEQPTGDPDEPWYKQYPPADVLEAQKKK